MIGTSPEFQQLVQSTHESVCQVDVIQDGVVTLTLDIYDGNVNGDRTAAQWRRFTADVADPTGSLTPTTVRDKLTPFGTTVKVYRGVFIPDVQTVSQDNETAADWALGTFTFMVTSGNALQLG